jgi:hypothetical protein
MTRNSGRFETTTKIKINTPHGSILKVVHYEIDEEPHDEYKVRQKCSICNGSTICLCYNDNNSDDPLQSAIDSLSRKWYCDKVHCICEYIKKNLPDKYEELRAAYNNNESAMVESLQDEIFVDDNDDDEIFCEI